jgi:hypothetical protein
MSVTSHAQYVNLSYKHDNFALNLTAPLKLRCSGLRHPVILRVGAKFPKQSATIIYDLQDGDSRFFCDNGK